MTQPATRIAVGLIGPGAIGGTFLKQLGAQRQKLHERYQIDAQVVGVIGSRRMLLNSTGIDLTDWRRAYEKGVKADLDAFFEGVRAHGHFAHRVFVDSTASEAIPEQYNRWLEAECHIITPNKKYGSGLFARYRKGRSLRAQHGAHFLYEATVGAGLPVISTLQSLLETGDRVDVIEGVFSGTLSYIFNTISTDVQFSQVVARAKANGFTEPDPREDLAGTDVARKVVVLARECGMEIELEDLEVESLVPSELQALPDAETFMRELPKYDAEMLSKVQAAEASDAVLRYVGVINIKEQRCEVGLRRYPRDHALARLNGTDNMMIFTTARYCTQPLVIQGPGAGAEVTAMGVFADFVSVAKRLKP